MPVGFGRRACAHCKDWESSGAIVWPVVCVDEQLKILLVEDSERLRRSLGHGLRREGHSVDLAVNGEESLDYAETYDYDVIILDLMLPKINGLDVLQRLRTSGRRTHILILSAQDQIETRITGLDLGADDYMVKPFSFDELKARMRALHRRGTEQKRPSLRAGPLHIDTIARIVRVGDRDATFSAKEYELVEFLARRPRQVFPQDAIIEGIYESGSEIASNVIEVLVYSIRRKIAEFGETSPIRNRRGQGYFIE